MKRREIPRIDYKELNATGKRVIKETRELEKLSVGFENLAIMASKQRQNLVDDEKKLVKKIRRRLDEYQQLSLLYDIEDLEKAISEFKDAIDSFDEIHIELERELDVEYSETYKDFSVLQEAKSWIHAARVEIKNRKVSKLEIEHAEAENSKLISQQEKEQSVRLEVDRLKTAEKYMRVRLDADLAQMRQVDSGFVDDLQQNIGTIRGFIEEYSSLFVQIENTFPPAEFTSYSDMYEKHMQIMNDLMVQMMEKVKNIRSEETRAKSSSETAKRLREHVLCDEKHERDERMHFEKIRTFDAIFDNIKERAYLLKDKYVIPLDDLDDSQILEKETELKYLDSDFSKILDLITELSKNFPHGYDKAEEIIKRAESGRDKLKNLKENYSMNLKKILQERDLSRDKVRNSQRLELELPKFSGYESKLNFYSFKSEFERLISPRITAPLLPDYLKNNYLRGHALEVVREIDDLDKIWERLKSSFGNVSILLNNKLDKVEKISPLHKTKSDEKFIHVATKLTNEMRELSILAKDHKIEDVLFHPSNLSKIYELVGRKRQTEFLKKHMHNDFSVHQKWEHLITFLDDEIKLTEELLIMNPNKSEKKDDSTKTSPKDKPGETKDKPGETKWTLNTDSSSQPNARCHLCGETDHIATLTKKGRYVINYFACPKFAQGTAEQRLALITDKGFCHQCLTPGQKKEHKGFCFKKYICPHDSHKTSDVGFHVLVCGKHKNDAKNVQLFDEYKEKYITSSPSLYKDFSKNICLHAVPEPVSHLADEDSPHSESKMFMLQTIQVASKKLNLFYDGGCGESTSKKSAVDFLSKIGRAHQTLKGPLVLNGVSDINVICKHGEWSVTLPLHNGEDFTMRGICLDKITSEFPTYTLEKLENDVHVHFGTEGGDPATLPKLPESVGGETDIMIGIQYLKIHPKPRFELPNGFTIFESCFKNPDGSRGMVAGPHRFITEILKSLNQSHMSLGAYLTDMARAFRDGYRISLDVSLLNGTDLEVYDMSSDDDIDEEYENVDLAISSVSSTSLHSLTSDPGTDPSAAELLSLNSPGDDPEVPVFLCFVCGRRPKLLERFDQVESAGTEVPYRCVKCRNCEDCKTGAKVECTSIREEVEQALVDKSVVVNIPLKKTTARLPFLTDPKYKLTSNLHIARKIYDRQLRQLNRSPKDKQDVIDTQNKLQS